MGAKRDAQRALTQLMVSLGPPFNPDKARRRAINPYSGPEVRAAAWANLRQWGYDTVQDKNGAWVTESEWHHNREEARLNTFVRLDRSEALKTLRTAIVIGGDERRRKNAWQRLRDHRVVLKTFDGTTIITEEIWRAWVCRG